MSVTIDQPTVQQRAAAATAELKRASGLNDLKLLSAAVAEAAAAEAVKNADFLACIRSIYAELTKAPNRQPRAKAPHQELPELIPLPDVDGSRFDPFAALNPYELLRLYGLSQMATALNGFSLEKLREAATFVKERHPGTKPKDGRRKDSLIAYIVEQMATE